MKKLIIDGSMPRAYVSWLEIVKKFYTEMLANTDLQTKIARLKVTADDLTAANTLLSEMESTRSKYLIEKGES